MVELPTADDLRAARLRLDGVAHRTPVVTSETLDGLSGRRLFFKCENLQKIGAFKIRGASNLILGLSDADAARGVVTHSSGNHAQAVALAARTRGIRAHVVMPANAPSVKRAAVEGYGAQVITCEPVEAERRRVSEQVLEETGGIFVPPFDHPQIVAGQATAIAELLEDVPHLDAVVAPVGGGGLLSGACLAVQASQLPVKVFGAEPLGADDAARSMEAGERIPQTGPNTIADGLLTSLSELTWTIIRQGVERVVTVEEDEIVAAMRLFWERTKLIIEPSAAVAVAAVLGPAFRDLQDLPRVGVVLSGGNVDLRRLPWTT